MIPWKQTLKSASISSIRRNIEFISENRHILLSKKLFHWLGRNPPPFLIGWWTFENMLREHFESCPGQSDRSTFEASEQKKWTLINYFLLPTLLEPKHWITSWNTQFSCCSILYLSAFILNFIHELSSCAANQTLFCSRFSFGVFKLWSSLISGPFEMI